MEAAAHDPLDGYWPEILGVVRRKVHQQTYDTWFLPLEPVGDKTDYRVSVPNLFFLDWFSEHHLPILNESASLYFGHAVDFQLEVRPEAETADDDLFRPELAIAPAMDTDPDTQADGPPEAGPSPTQTAARANLNPDYTFENFVVSGSTDLAYAASSAVAKQPGTYYNPLFIHGGVGLGKTHLMHALGNAIAETRPGARICYLTGERFMNELIASIQDRTTHAFKSKYRSMDVLLIDDVAFIAGKETTQEEFFHTFNALHDERKQIVLASDRPPKEITTLEERLRSRFEWGLIVDIQPPNLETRIAILQRKVASNNIMIADDVITYIAENITDNVRKLEGALIRLLAFASLMRKEISLDLASEVLSSYFEGNSAGPVRIADVIEVVADHFGFTVDQLKSKRRTQDLARARQMAMHLARELTGASLNQIGRAFGGRDHSTVAHACNVIDKLSQSEARTRGLIKELTEKIRGGRRS